MAKKRAKWLLYGGLTLLFVVLLVVSILLLMASSVPDDYIPPRLSPQERKEMAEHLVRNYMVPFINSFQVAEPFEVTLDENDLNGYLASLDEIHADRPDPAGEHRKTGGVYEAMDQAGLAGPVVAMHEGKLTLMIRERKANKVISADLTFHPTDDGKMGVRLEQVRVGKLPVPAFVVDEALSQFKERMRELLPDADDADPGMDEFIASLVTAINEGPQSTDLTIDKQTKRTHRVEIREGEMTISIVPVQRDD